MTAKTKHGYKGHETHGADHGTAHERLMRQHRRPGRAEGAALDLNDRGPGAVHEGEPANPFTMPGPETDGELPGMPGAAGMAPPGAEPMPEELEGPGAEPDGDTDDAGD